MTERCADLAVQWSEAWIQMDMERLRKLLAPDFVHLSPFGGFDDRETYLGAVEPGLCQPQDSGVTRAFGRRQWTITGPVSRFR